MYILVFTLVSGLQVHSKYLLAMSLAIYLARLEERYEEEEYDDADAN